MAKTSKGNKQSRRERRARRSQMPPLKGWALWGSLALAAVGGVLSLYATQLTYRIASSGVVEVSGCTINSWINCDAAHASSYATLLGIPVAWWGFLFYAFVGLIALYATQTKDSGSAAGGVTVAWIMSLAAVAFSVYKAFNLYSLGVLCLVCLGMYGVNIGLAVLLPMALGLGFGQWGGHLSKYVKELMGTETDLAFDPKPVRYGTLLVVLFGLGLIGMKNYADRRLGNQEINLEAEVTAHFRQAAFELAIPEDAVVWGNPDAEITVVEFGDFQCPACREAAFHLRPALFEYRDRVRLYFLNFPLDNTINENLQGQTHVQAGPAAKASVCASEEGDFWGFHDDLFRDQASLGPRLYQRLVEDRGWDMAAFSACMDSPETVARVKGDIAVGMSIQLGSTPTLLIAGRKVSKWRSNEVLRAIIEEELSR